MREGDWKLKGRHSDIPQQAAVRHLSELQLLTRFIYVKQSCHTLRIVSLLYHNITVSTIILYITNYTGVHLRYTVNAIQRWKQDIPQVCISL